MSAHKTDGHARRGRRRVHPLKDEATFDTELQRYIMPSERHANMPKQGKSELDERSAES
jgi:hypothetical protein